MTALFHRLNEEIELEACNVSMLVEWSALDEHVRDQLSCIAALDIHPLLTQPEFDNLRAIGPVLLGWNAPGLAALSPLYERVPMLQPGLRGWLTSKTSTPALAAHLSGANVVHSPQGEQYLLRYHAPQVLHALHQHRDAWTDAFFAPLVSWWSLQSGGGWRRYAGGCRASAPALSSLQTDEALWHLLNAGNSEPHAMLGRLQRLQPPLFSATCPGVRLKQVETLLAEADEHRIAGGSDRQAYALLRLQHGDTLARDRRWSIALHDYHANGTRLLDAWATASTR